VHDGIRGEWKDAALEQSGQFMTISFRALRKSATLRTILVFASGNTLAMGLGVVGSFVQARYIGPEDMGVFRTFGIAAGYLTFLQMGVFDGLQREIPLQMGRGDQAKAERAAAACLAWILFVSIACGVIFLGLAARAAMHREWMQFWGWLAYTPAMIATFYGGYLGTTFRTGQQFIRLSKTSVIQAIVGSLALPLMPLMGYFGACLRTAITSLAGLLLLHRWRPMRVRPRIDWPGFREVIRIGVPLSGAGYIYTSLWVSMEGSFVLAWYGVKALGLYSVAVFVRTVVTQLAQNMNQVMQVKIYEQYGRSNSVSECVRLVRKPTTIAFLASLPLVAVAWLAIPWAIGFFIPKYVDAAPMMQWIVLTMPLTFLSLPATILWASGRGFYFFTPAIVGFLTFVGGAYLLHGLGIGVVGVLIASMLGNLMYSLLSYALIFFLGLERKLTMHNEEY